MEADFGYLITSVCSKGKGSRDAGEQAERKDHKITHQWKSLEQREKIGSSTRCGISFFLLNSQLHFPFLFFSINFPFFSFLFRLINWRRSSGMKKVSTEHSKELSIGHWELCLVYLLISLLMLVLTHTLLLSNFALKKKKTRVPRTFCLKCKKFATLSTLKVNADLNFFEFWIFCYRDE